MNTNLRVGDKVIVSNTYVLGCDLPDNSKGKIIDIDTHIEIDMIGVEFDKPFSNGHHCNYHGKDGYCWYVSKDNIKVLNKVTFTLKDYE
jgi:hypothetical protein